MKQEAHKDLQDSKKRKLAKVRRSVLKRSGLKKYGTPLTRNDLTLEQWITHLQEELMDATLYLERIKKEIERITSKRIQQWLPRSK
jgi:hypothetical protein